MDKIDKTGPGRHILKDSERKKKAFTICLTEDTYTKLVELARANRQPLATMVRLIVEDAVEGTG